MSDGHCEVDFGDHSDDCDPVEFYESSLVKARKEHKCSECDGVIAKGEKYRRTAYKFEGDFDMDRLCASCMEIADEFNYHLMGGSFWVMFREEWENGATLQGCLNRLETAKAKAHMREQWQKWQDARELRRRQALEFRKARGAVDPVDGRGTEGATRV